MKLTLHDIDAAELSGRPVLVRSDLNVPVEDGRITDDQRIVASLPTLATLQAAGARVAVLSHLGRPKGAPDPGTSLSPVAARLAEALGIPVPLVGHDEPLDARMADLEPGDVVLVENTRWLPGETANDPELARRWAEAGDLFVNDAFGTAHRAHASTAGLAEAMIAKGGRAVAGELLARELDCLEEVLRAPERPFTAIVGGAKISSKIGVISALLPRVDRLLVGGAMANTFFRALGLDTGASLVEEDAISTAAELIEQGGERLMLPLDCIVADAVAPGAPTRVAARDAVSGSDKILDIGPRSIESFRRVITASRSIVWNGPMGVFEIDDFAAGTVAVAEAVAEACDDGAMGVLGGGDSAAAALRAGVVDRLTHVSTGGGASLDFLAGETLPGVAALSPRTSTTSPAGAHTSAEGS